MRSQRQLMVGEELRHALAEILLRGDVPWPEGSKPPEFVTVTEVQVSPDLKNATAFVVVRGEGDARKAIKSMNEISGFFRKELSSAVRLRYMPKLNFKQDNSFDYAQNINRILNAPEVSKDLD